VLKFASGAAFAVMVVGIAGLDYAGSLFLPNPIVIVVQVAAISLIIWARLTFGMRSFHATANPTSGGVVSSGPYRYWRHPIYSAAIYFTAAPVAAHFTVWALVCFALVIAGGVTRMLSEEHLLVRRYPDYRDYMRRTKRFIPFVI
jgi:protein-S-isoprenylcysteine O-methyltransferase Ste14